MRNIKAVVATGASALLLSLGVAVAASPAEAKPVAKAPQAFVVKGYNYQATATCQPRNEGNDRGYTWAKVSSWWLDSTHKKYHISWHEDTGFQGSQFHVIYARKYGTWSTTKWYGSSPYDNNPQEYYKIVSGTYQRDIIFNWTDVTGGLPWGNISCYIVR